MAITLEEIEQLSNPLEKDVTLNDIIQDEKIRKIYEDSNNYYIIGEYGGYIVPKKDGNNIKELWHLCAVVIESFNLHEISLEDLP